ncbi:FadR/GntR family transcriptional regulator [Rhodobacter sp. NSM]|uniref:FadR/GntR family transcriptional regulator n=1 Tax=Rhodobacter sp. NSM TaxID=3457501 RepID=UPI003FD54BB2
MSEPGSLIRSLSGRQPARNFHSFVINDLGRSIVSGERKAGSVLPGDAEMIARYGVSRTVLREALKTLESKGLVEARPKVGTRVLPAARWTLFDRQVLRWMHEAGPEPAFLTSAFAVRRLLELEVAALAARGRSAEHLRQMGYWLGQRLDASDLPEAFALAEFEFHRILCEASGNPLLRAATALTEFALVTWVSARRGSGGLAEAKHPVYLRLFSAIEAGDPLAAREAMAAILDHDEAQVRLDATV